MAMKDAIVRDPGPVQVEVSPIPHGLPTEPDHPLDKRGADRVPVLGEPRRVHPHNRGAGGVLVRLPDPDDLVDDGQLEEHHHWFKLIVVGGLTVIAFRITFYPWPFKKLDD